MRASELVTTLDNCDAIRLPVMITGPSGVGKSDIVAQTVMTRRKHRIAKASIVGNDALELLAAPLTDSTYYGLIDFRAALRDAVDIMGLPSAKDGITFYNMPAGLPRSGAGILFLDEVNSAPAQTQAALYQLMLPPHRVGDYELPEGWQIVAAGNRQNDRGVVHRMPDPLTNRMLQVELETHLGDWTQWALTHDIRPETIAFLRFRPDLLHMHDVQRKCLAFPTPRTWGRVSQVLGLSSPVESHLIRGLVGDAAAGEFMAFLQLYRNMVSPDSILLNPTKAEVPENASILYALAEALARRATVKNFDAILTYGKRMPAEYAQAMIASATTINPALCNTAEFIKWASSRD